MSHRVIAGSAKGRKLQLVPGNTTRPVKDLVKESVFNIIGVDIVDAAFLDLFAGTGAVGIEALSRGAAQVVFCDMERLAIKTIHENLKHTQLADRAVVRRTDSMALIEGKPPQNAYDFIYVAPPQYKELWVKALQILDKNDGWIGEHTQVIVQIDPDEYQDLRFDHLEVVDERKYGKTKVVFYMRKEIAVDG